MKKGPKSTIKCLHLEKVISGNEICSKLYLQQKLRDFRKAYIFKIDGFVGCESRFNDKMKYIFFLLLCDYKYALIKM